jgi:hypothetical protein
MDMPTIIYVLGMLSGAVILLAVLAIKGHGK